MLNVGDIVLFKEGREDKNVAWDKDGKVVLCTHDIPIGYAKIDSVVEKPKYYLVKATPVVHDYFEDMTYHQFLELLQVLNFKVGFDFEFDYTFIGGCGHRIPKKEHEILAYNLDLNMVIVAITWDEGRTFDTIRVYCPGLDPKAYFATTMFAQDRDNVTVFDLTYRNHYRQPLRQLIDIVTEKKKENPANIIWGTQAGIDLHNYDDLNESFWPRTIERLLLAPAEIDTIFANCNCMQNVLAKRDKE